MRKRMSTGIIALVAALLLFSCKKINLEDEEKSLTQHNDLYGLTEGRGSSINPTCGRSIYGKVASFNNGIDTLNLVKDSGVVYYINTPSLEQRPNPVIIYKIPFSDNSELSPHFLLIATDLTETKFKGNEIRINPSNDYRISGIFDGTITCKPIDSTITETFNYENG
ncbi:hypothetical protein, partial [Flavihumibacter sp. CACIAM 22H1]|uniref:hypothetical protein n=1 Tax=Flavihumibacter sp. CACIAM 22H1 TaxID=1812911 RepID=UPI000B32EA22